MELRAHLEPDAAWRETRAELRRTVGESTYEIWLATLELSSFDGQTMVLEAPADTRAWVAKRFAHLLERCAGDALGSPVRVVLAGGENQPEDRASPDATTASDFHPRYSFDQFIIGDGNRLAHAAALAVAELPGQAYNPLFLHAPPGLGKTHLLHAIGNYVLAFGNDATVRYTTVEAFTNHFISALSSKSLERFKRSYRDADILLIDDVQFLASKARTEEEFFHTFNSLYETGRQLVLTCDRLPRQLISVQDRLRERFEAGLVADIRPPDFATRVAILRKRVTLDHIELDDVQVLDLIAERVTANVRMLEGALIRVVAQHSLTREPIGIELANRVLAEIHPATGGGAPTIPVIQASVARRYELTVPELTSASRTARIAWPRQLAIHLSRQLTEASLNTIGQAFGGRNHATVLHACKRVAERLRTDAAVAGELEDLTRDIDRAVRDPQDDRVD